MESNSRIDQEIYLYVRARTCFLQFRSLVTSRRALLRPLGAFYGFHAFSIELGKVKGNPGDVGGPVFTCGEATQDNGS